MIGLSRKLATADQWLVFDKKKRKENVVVSSV
jgi:hypothetical protein